MPSAEKRGSKYRATWTVSKNPRRQEHRSGFTSYSDAMAFAREQEERALAGIDTASVKMTWGEWKTVWLEHRQVEASTSDADLPRIEKWLGPKWGAVPLGEINSLKVQAWVNWLRTQTSPGSVAKIYHIFSASMTAAVKAHVLLTTPCQHIELPPVPVGLETFYTREQMDQILDRVMEPYRTAYVLMVGTGMRFGEVAGLHWSRVDLDARLIFVAETWSPTAQKVKLYPKGRRLRSVPLSDWVLQNLDVPENRLQGNCGLEHEEHGRRCVGRLVVPSPRGGALDDHNMRSRHWKRALEAVGLIGRQHDLRHTFASWLAQDGVPLGEIAAVLGHTETYVTERYRHWGTTHLERVRAAMNGHGPVPTPAASVPTLVPTLVPTRDLKIASEA